MTDQPTRRYARPIDRSLEAYKAWIQNMVRAMGGPTGTTTDEEWVEMHAEFWADEDKQEATDE
jgi:hypothetical protein